MIKTVDQVKALNRYIKAVSGAKRISTNYRFNRASFKLDSRGRRDLERMAAFFEENSFDQIILAGFSDSRGDYRKNYMLSCRRAERIRVAFEKRGINVENALCVGEEVPVASNKTQAGREKNRRVEVWVK
jgi:phosphate transport system substrate-binding protein